MIGCKQFGVNALPRSVFRILTALVASILPAAAVLAHDSSSSFGASFAWVEISSALVLLVSGIVIWIIARNQTKRIRELKREAEKLRDADFGEPLRVRPGELGELAAVFNDMRDRLKATTSKLLKG